MPITYKLSELIIDYEDPQYVDYQKLKNDKEKKIKEVCNRNKIRHITWIDNPKNIKSITTPDGRELSPEELFDFVIGNNITDLANSKTSNNQIFDIAIVLGNIALPTTRERAIKACQLYKLGLVKKIIFTGGISKSRDKKNFYHLSPSTYNNNKIVNNLNWEDLSEADWGTELFFENIYNKDYQKHITQLTKNFLKTSGINPEDILIESMSSTTQENAEFCKNIFNIEAAESGLEINSAILVTTCTHGNRAIEQFKKVFGNRIKLDWCPSTIDLEKYESLKSILKNPNFDEIAFRKELKQVYCSTPELIQSLREEIGHHRNVFIRGEINEPIIETVDTQAISKNNFIR